LIISQYMALLRSKKTEIEIERILSVYDFLLSERNKLARDLGIVVIR
jgi:hypothetical protein